MVGRRLSAASEEIAHPLHGPRAGLGRQQGAVQLFDPRT
jgi:hypothetical protein